MLNRLLTLTRPLFIFDTETTGTDPNADRIVEIGLQEWNNEGRVDEWRTLVNPGIPIPEEATAIHHITDADVKDVPTFDMLSAGLLARLADCDFGGQNVRFDLKIVAAEMKRARRDWDYSNAYIIDSHRLEAVVIPRDLGSLHEKYVGYKHDGAHGALSDVRASATVIVCQLESHDSLPRTLDALHELQWPGYIDTEGLFKIDNGVPMVAFGKYRGKRMASVPQDYWSWIAGPKAGFSDEIKAIALNAARGVFPRPRMIKCDGNHGGMPCGDKECWLKGDDNMTLFGDGTGIR